MHLLFRLLLFRLPGRRYLNVDGVVAVRLSGIDRHDRHVPVGIELLDGFGGPRS